MKETPSFEPKKIDEIMANGVPTGETDANRAADKVARDLASEYKGLQVEREDLAGHALETGDPAVSDALGQRVAQQVEVRADMHQRGIVPPIPERGTHE